MGFHNFKTYINRHRSSRAKAWNFQSPRPNQGVYYFKEFNDFFTRYVHAYPSFTPEKCTSLIFKPRRDLNMNCYLDFDLKCREPIFLQTSVLARFARKVVKILGNHEFVLTRRVSSYLKETKKESYFANGFHLWILGKFSLQQCLQVRNTILETPDRRATYKVPFCEPQLRRAR